ncbi:pimeloyl-ACP methyl ester carboxylesterase [Mycolicibacterium mucogenicum 261Sha1.1M5]|nr:pimeloyl-ACP methyl ester carboxylesterase [Mycolicibacterium mucogenicum 261Sha1.1M5]
MNSHTYRTVDVPVPGGQLRVGVWDPVTPAAGEPTALAVHGVTASHLAWQFVVEELPGIRILAPDLRGRGASNGVDGPAGMAAHAADLVAVLDAFGEPSVPVFGHSMGAFVAVTLAHLAPERVARLVLIDGGLPLDAPAGVSAEALVQAILGPTAERLSMRFADITAYLDFWRAHPAFVRDWSAELESYFAYDLVPAGDAYRPATSLATTTDDTVDMNTGTTLTGALAALPGFPGPVDLVTVPNGLLDERPGLYPPRHLAALLAALPNVRHTELDDLNHYTVVMSGRGARAVAPILTREFSAH